LLSADVHAIKKLKMEGKTIQQIKDEVAKENLRESWLHLLYELTERDSYGTIQRLENNVIERYARQQCELQISACAVHSITKSILTAKNVCDGSFN